MDDTLTLVDLLRDVLESEGYRVAVCLESRAACDMARHLRPDLVVLDIVMPEVSGWEVRACLRAEHGLAGLPIVVCTAWAEQAAAELRRLRDPGLWLLPKPFEIDDLLGTVEEALERARTQRFRAQSDGAIGAVVPSE